MHENILRRTALICNMSVFNGKTIIFYICDAVNHNVLISIPFSWTHFMSLVLCLMAPAADSAIPVRRMVRACRAVTCECRLST